LQTRRYLKSTHTDVVMMSLTCTLQKHVELLTSVGDDLVVKTMVPRFSTEVATPRNYSCVINYIAQIRIGATNAPYRLLLVTGVS